MRKYFLLLLCSIGMFWCCGKKQPLKVVLISGSNEYFSDISLKKYKTYLKENFANLNLILLKADGELNEKGEYSNLSGLNNLEHADVVLLFLRRTTIENEQLERIQKFINSGKGIVVLRTSSHGFQNWLEFDKIVLGGNYHGHYKGSPEKSKVNENGARYPEGQPIGPTQEDEIVQGVEDHPVLKGISNFRSRYSLYRTSPVADDVKVLMTGKIPNEEPEPVVWVKNYKKSRVAYIGLGGLQDWENDTFKRLVTNSIFWTGNKTIDTVILNDPAQRPHPKGNILLNLRSREQKGENSDQWREVTSQKEFGIGETAFLICDMWDKHWCKGATRRCEQLAKKMNHVVKAAREKGIQIIHAPSETMFFYKDRPQRQRMLSVPPATKPKELVINSPSLPVKVTDDGCDTPDDKPYSAWTRQSPYIEIGEYDGISDNGDEIYNFFKYQGIKNMIIMGVHTNMCVLNRSFGIKQMLKWGVNCILVRDLTDAMYDPKDFPYVSHKEGVELVIQHIEKYWCPSILSEDLLTALE